MKFHCKNCKNRHLGCHADCADYQAVLTEYRKERENLREYKKSGRSSASIKMLNIYKGVR